MPDWMSLLLLLAYGLTCLVAGAIVVNLRWVIRELPKDPVQPTLVAGVPVWDLDDECDPETLDSMEIL